MNNLRNATVYMLVNLSDPEYIKAGAVVREACDNLTMVNVAALDDSSDGIYNVVDALSDNTYDYIVVACNQSTSGGTGIASAKTMAKLRVKLKTASRGTLVTSGTCSNSGGANTIVLSASSSVTNDYYNGLYVVTTGGTGSGQVGYIINYVGSTKTATVNAWGGDTPDTTTTYEIYDVPNIINGNLLPYSDGATAIIGTNYVYINRWGDFIRNNNLHASGTAKYNSANLIWLQIHGDHVTGLYNPFPKILQLTGGYELYKDISGAGGGTNYVQVSSPTFTANALVGKWIYIYNGTSKGEWARIASNTTTKITGAYFNATNPDVAIASYGSTWNTTTDNTSRFIVCERYSEILAPAYLQLVINGILNDLTNGETVDMWKRLLNNTMAGGTTIDNKLGAPYQDDELLYSLIEKGKSLYDAIIERGVSVLV